MHNLLLIARREYLERVRNKWFLIGTLGLPLLMAVSMILPQKLVMMKPHGSRHIVVAASNTELAALVKKHLETDVHKEAASYEVELSPNVTNDARQVLINRVSKGEILAYVWLTDDAVKERNVTYTGRDMPDFSDVEAVRDAIFNSRVEQRLATIGVGPDVSGDLLQKFEVDTSRVEKGKESKTSALVAFFTSYTMLMLLWVTLMLYGVAVMRSVLEEKTSRVMEVLLSSVNSTELMLGKVFGVGAVGLTQVLIWIVLAVTVALPAAASSGVLKQIHISPAMLAGFTVFFVLGYLLYSCVYAAIGAMVNSEQEGQQLQMVGMAPLITALMMVMFVMRQPDSPVAVWSSMFPFFAPVLMFVRISVQTPPVWQIVLSVVLLLATIWGMMVLCGRIYRIGVLMYGKRPTLPEILKWMKYAKV